MILRITALGIALQKVTYANTAIVSLCWMSFMLSVAIKFIVLNDALSIIKPALVIKTAIVAMVIVKTVSGCRPTVS